MTKNTIALRIALDAHVYREIEISGEASLYKLAEVINNVFGFDFDHAFGFYDDLKNTYNSKNVYELFKDIGEPTVEHAKSVKRSRVQDAFDKDGRTFAFLFDYGDDWLFEVKRVSARPSEAPKNFWKLIKSVGDAPKQYPDYEEEDGDERPFEEKYEMIKVGDLTVARRREPKG